MPEKAGRPARRSYDQYCGVAYGLDVIGERWTLLLVRELLLGPRRYKDLLAGLPGIGTNLLAARLRELEELGLIRRTVLPPPAGSTVYELTETGRGLEPVVRAIGRWGARMLAAPRSTDTLVPSAYFVAMRSVFHPERAAGLTETFEVRIAERVFEVRVEDGTCETREGRPSHPDVVMAMDVETIDALVFGRTPSADLLAAGRIELQGDPAAVERFATIFAFRPRPSPEVRETAAAR
jgi:DNA-binding HxlR family transcriptional regulator/putative sterol carrier protein